MLQRCLCQQFLSSHSKTLEFSVYRMLSFDLWSKYLNDFKFKIRKGAFNCRLFLIIFPGYSNLFALFELLFLVTPCLVAAVQPCMEWISIFFFFFWKENKRNKKKTKVMVTQEKMCSGLYFSSTWTNRIYRVIETMPKFMFVYIN